MLISVVLLLLTQASFASSQLLLAPAQQQYLHKKQPKTLTIETVTSLYRELLSKLAKLKGEAFPNYSPYISPEEYGEFLGQHPEYLEPAYALLAYLRDGKRPEKEHHHHHHHRGTQIQRITVITNQDSEAELHSQLNQAYAKGKTPSGLCMGLSAFLGGVLGAAAEFTYFALQKSPTLYFCFVDPFGGGALVENVCRDEENYFSGYVSSASECKQNSTFLQHACMYFADGPYFPANVTACNTHPCIATDPDTVAGDYVGRAGFSLENLQSWWTAIPLGAMFIPCAIEVGIRIHRWRKYLGKRAKYSAHLRELAQSLHLPEEIIVDLAFLRM